MTTHNLNIQTYSFEEILGLFELSKEFNEEDIKRAKKKVLWMHPDKSRLPSEYFLFYKKAYETLLVFFEEKTKQDKVVPNTEIAYVPMNTSENKKVGKVINAMKAEEFNNVFNEMFDKNMVKPQDSARNEWFKQSNALYEVPETVTQQGMGQALNKVREKTNEMTRYRGVETMYSGGAGGTKLYDEEENPTEFEYVSSDIFGKLKYDDLRRVHKDQTVFSVSESDFQNMTKYTSIDHLSSERGKQNLTPMDKQKSEDLIKQQQQHYKDAMMKKQYEAQLRTMEYSEKNKTVLANFLRLNS